MPRELRKDARRLDGFSLRAGDNHGWAEPVQFGGEQVCAAYSSLGQAPLSRWQIDIDRGLGMSNQQYTRHGAIPTSQRTDIRTLANNSTLVDWQVD